MPVSSARPANLTAYTDRTVPLHARLDEELGALDGPLAELRSSSGDYVANLADLDTELLDLVQPAVELDVWVATVGHAFAEAGSGDGLPPGSFAADDADLDALVVPVGGEPAEPGGAPFVLGDPTRPRFEWDADFPGDSEEPTWEDRRSYAKWQAMLHGGELLRPDLDDATALYRRYLENSGEPMEIDYEELYREDRQVRVAVDGQVRSAREWADHMAASGATTSFRFTGDAVSAGDLTGSYPTATENGQKTLGGYQLWSSADVQVDGDQVTMTVTVHAEDKYNFNAGQADIATQAPDDANVRFAQVGWAKGFEVHGSVERTVTWTLGDPAGPSETANPGGPERNPGREDREDGLGSGNDRGDRPTNDRETGRRGP